ncbi:MAG TPA: hypothetical protein DEO54_03940 [Rikenellaceae bacterium]|nr:MAG: hypothetical protein A2X20_04460 [Bacteroidetes bacterium GWE2_40_15]HBZ25377.1 hypothetical protein [Rikenellaceae bacterium]
MSNDKMDSSAVYTLFEELKQKMVALSAIDTCEISEIVEELRKLANQKQFTSEQVKELQENMAHFTKYSLEKAFGKFDSEFSKVIDILIRINEKWERLNVPANSVIRKEHVFMVDFKNSKAAITMIAMGLMILLSVGGNIWQDNKNSQLQDNDLKYRYIKMQEEASTESLYKLEIDFTYNRNKDSISIIRKRVEVYERLVKEQAEKIEQARMNASEAERLQKEVETMKNK